MGHTFLRLVPGDICDEASSVQGPEQSNGVNQRTLGDDWSLDFGQVPLLSWATVFTFVKKGLDYMTF